MSSQYIEMREHGYYVAGARVSLDSIVHCFNEGFSAEAIQQEFPTLKLSQVYGAIAYYLDHRAEVDEYLAETEREFEASGVPMKEANPRLWEKIQSAKNKAAENIRER